MPTDREFRWGVVGTGNIAGQFCRDLKALPGHVLSAVASRDADRAMAFCQLHGGTAVGSYEELLDDPGLDGIYVSLPNTLHAEWATKCLRAGFATLCEKPLATSRAEAEAMFAAAAKADRPLVEAFMYRCHPQTHAVLDAVRRGDLGTVTGVRASFCYRTTKLDGNVRFDPTLAGGALMDVGCYCLDMACQIADATLGRHAEVADASAVSRMHARGVDAMTTGHVAFVDGPHATFQCALDTQADNTLTVVGTGGFLTVAVPWKPRADAGYTLSRGARPKQELKPGESAEPPPPQFVATPADLPLYALEAEAFARHVRGGASFMRRQDSLRLASLVERVRRR
jgi:predicted dehydrogenase